MEPPRRFAKFLSALFLATGTLILIYVAGTWYLSMQLPPILELSSAGGSSLSNLPPALNPAAPAAGPTNKNRTVDPPAAVEAQEETPLLPQSPPGEENTAAGEVIAAAASLSEARPLRIIIPALGIDAPVYPAGLQTAAEGQREYQQWSVPDTYAAGWHESSAPLGQTGNIVLNGHNNIHGAIFGELRKLAVGEQIVLVGADQIAVYRVAHHELVKESGLSLRDRLQNARWIAPTEDKRLTLVTCWPNTTNSHRLILVALPDGETLNQAAPAG